MPRVPIRTMLALMACLTMGCWQIPPVTYLQGKPLPVVPLAANLALADVYDPLAGLVVTSEDRVVTGFHEVVALDVTGNEVWSHSHGETFPPTRLADIEIARDAIYATGVVALSPFFTVPPEHYVLKLSQTGEVIWRETLVSDVIPTEGELPERESFLREMAPMPDGGFAVAGGGWIRGVDFTLLVMRGDADGGVVWTYEDSAALRQLGLFDVKAWDDGGLLLMGMRDTPSLVPELVFISLSPTGDFEWEQAVRGVADDYWYLRDDVSDLVRLPDGHYALASTRGDARSRTSIVEIDRGGDVTIRRNVIQVFARWTSAGPSMLGLEWDDDHYEVGLAWPGDFPHFRLYDVTREGSILGKTIYSRCPAPLRMGRLDDGRHVFVGTDPTTTVQSFEEPEPFMLLED
jgi:hypothetical protein